MTGYAGYTGYSEDSVKRQRAMADALMQRTQQPRKVEHWTQGVSQLAEALLARQAMDKADTSEKAYKTSQQQIADALIGDAFPDAQTSSATQLAAPAPYDLTPKAAESRAGTASLGGQVKMMAKLTGNPMQAMQYGQGVMATRQANDRYQDETQYAHGRDLITDQNADRAFGLQEDQFDFTKDSWKQGFDRSGEQFTDTFDETRRHNMATEKTSISRQPPSGYNWTPEGLLAPITGGPADPKRSGVEIDPKIISLETQQSGKWMPIQNDFADIRANFDRISTLAKNKNSASDLGLIVSFTKMLDPGSVAREGEVQLTQQAAGLIDQASVWLPRLQSGKTLLPDNVRQMYVDAARSMFGSYEKTYQGLARDTQSRASQYGLSPDRIMLGYDAPAPMNGKAAASPAMQLGVRAYAKQSNLPAEAITEFLSNPSTPQEIAEFNDEFGEGQAEAILKAMQSGR